MSTPDAQLPGPTPVSRLTFAYEGHQVRLVSEQHVNMILPPSDPIEFLERPGFSVILRDERGVPVYGRALASPFRFDQEVFDKDPERSIRREVNPQPKGTFVLFVPAIETARHVELFGQPLKPKAHLESPRKLATFTLRPLDPR